MDTRKKKKMKSTQKINIDRTYLIDVFEYNKKILGQRKNFVWFLLLPVIFAYDEILLRILSRRLSLGTIYYPILFSIALGFFGIGLLRFFDKKVQRFGMTILLYIAAFLFTVECIVRNSFQHYMNFSALLTGTGDVVGDYKSELLGAVLGGIPIIILFFGPALFYTKFWKKFIPDKKFRNIVSVELILISFCLFVLTLLFVNTGGNKGKYKGQYEFNLATEAFGLLTSIRLDGKYALFGNSGTKSFDLVQEAGEEDETIFVQFQADQQTVLGKNQLNVNYVKQVLKNAVIIEKSGNKKLITLNETGEGIFNSTSSITEIEQILGKAGEPVVYGKNKMDINFKKLAKKEKNKTYKELDTYVASLKASKQNKYTGLFKGKNLILICAEAFSDAAINKKLTPTLYRLMHNGFYFSDYYQPQWGGSTSTGEFSFVMGLAPMNSVKTMLDAKNNNNYFTMGNQLQRLDYYSIAYHDGTYTYYDRNKTHKNLGYDKFSAYGNGLEDVTGLWTGDGPLLDKTLDSYIDKQPFSIYYMTVSGHFPYKHSDSKVKKYQKKVKKVLGDSYKQTTLDYYCYQMELEAGLKKMVNKLEKAGIADHTVICLTADHYPYGLSKSSTYGNSEDYLGDLYGYKPKTPWERDRNACIIWSGCLENENKDMACEVSDPTYSLDIVPTLSNLFGTEYDSRLLVGRDVFSDTEPLVLWSGYSWVTKEGKYDASTGKYYPNEGYKKDKKYIEKMSQIVANKLKFSKDVVNSDYYRELFGADPDNKKK